MYAGYPERADDVPGCGEDVTTYQDLNLYVAFYCDFSDFMAYDDGDDSLLAPLAAEFGPAVMGIVLAHEYGHAIQSRVGALDEFLATIYTEQQADCFSGAWAGQAYRGESPLLRLGDADVRAGLVAMLEVRDPVGTDQFVDGGHGSAFDRVGAFQEGFVNGVQRCSELLDEPLTLMPNEFQSTEDLVLEGNAPYDCEELRDLGATDEAIAACRPAPVFLADDLNHFWVTELGSDFSALAEIADLRRRQLRLLRRRAAGERGPALPIAERGGVRRARRAQTCTATSATSRSATSTGSPGPSARRSSRAARCRASSGRCSTTATPAPGCATSRPTIRRRPADPAIATVTAATTRSAPRPATSTRRSGWRSCSATPVPSVNQVGSPFEKIESFRAGVLGGLDACNSRFGL